MKFSNFSSLLNVPYTMTATLTFENFLQMGHDGNVGISDVSSMEEGETETWALRDLEGKTVLTLVFNLEVI